MVTKHFRNRLHGERAIKSWNLFARFFDKCGQEVETVEKVEREFEEQETRRLQSVEV